MQKPFEEALNELLAEYPSGTEEVISALELALMAQQEQAAQDKYDSQTNGDDDGQE